MNLIVDIGNSSVKAAVFDGESLVYRKRLGKDPADALAMIAEDFDIDACAYLSVGCSDHEAEAVLYQITPSPLCVTGLTPTPLVCDYRSPESLGADRLAVAVGAVTLAEGVPLLIVDAGTCITYEYVSADAHYLGGNISPGLGMRLRSLNEQTARLPLVNNTGDMPAVGYNTATAIRTGVIHGLELEIDGYVREFRHRHPEGRVFVTGGNGYRFAREQEAEHNDTLVEIGLNRILRHNS